MAKKPDNDSEISKRHDTDLWREIRTLYESKTKPTYEKIKTILVAEFQLEKFPSRTTVLRRADKEGWKRVRSGENPVSNRFDDAFWSAVRVAYESNPKITHKQLRDLVQNELQCNEFPSAQALAAKAKAEGWERSESLVKKGDTDLKKLKKMFKNAVVMDGDASPDLEVYTGENEGDFIDDPNMVAEAKRVAQDEILKIKNLTMMGNSKRQKLADVILLSRKRMRTVGEIGDMLSDRMMELHLLLGSDEFLAVCPPGYREKLEKEQKNLFRTVQQYNEISFSRRESIKFELSLYGVQVDDLRDNDNEARMKDLNDDSAYEKQRQRLLEEREAMAQRRAYILSGGLQREVDEAIQRQMDEMNEAEDAEYEEIN